MEPLATFRITLFLNSGQTVQSEVQDDPAEPEDMAQELTDKLANGRPRWMRFGNVVAFSGAVSGIEIEAL